MLVLSVSLSFALFWLRAVEGNINFINICKLMVGGAIIFPVFFVTENLRIQLKKIFGGKYKYLKLCLYIISVSTFYSIVLTISYYPITFTTFFNFLIILICQPFFILILKYFFIDRLKRSEWSKVFLFILIVLGCEEAYFFFTDIFFAYYQDYHFALLRIYIPGISKCFNLLILWGSQLPIILILLSDIPSDYLGFHRKWDRKAIVATLFIVSIMILNFEISRNVMHFNIGSKQYVIWNILTFSYHALFASFSEEIIFRGIIQNYISRKLALIKDGNIFAIIITAIIFALVHFPFSGKTITFVNAFFFGLIMGWLYNKTHNIWSPILVHGIHNLIVSAIIL